MNSGRTHAYREHKEQEKRERQPYAQALVNALNEFTKESDYRFRWKSNRPDRLFSDDVIEVHTNIPKDKSAPLKHKPDEKDCVVITLNLCTGKLETSENKSVSFLKPNQHKVYAFCPWEFSEAVKGVLDSTLGDRTVFYGPGDLARDIATAARLHLSNLRSKIPLASLQNR